MSKLRNLLALTWLGTLIALLFSNLGERLTLTLLLAQTTALPLGLWLVLASLAGAVTTLAIALLNRRPARAIASPESREPQTRRSRRPWKRSPEDEWTFMGVGDGEESWDNWPGASDSRETAAPEPEVIETSFRVLRPATGPQTAPPQEPRRPEPAPKRPTSDPVRSPNTDDWDFVERDDW